jgi:hypothetical protein
MAGIGENEASSCTNPLIQFFYQESGFLMDLNALSFTVNRVAEIKMEVVSTVVVDVAQDCPTGDRLGTGRYAARIDPSADGLGPGSYEVVWAYQPAAGDPLSHVVQPFEVVSKDAFSFASLYRGYASSFDLGKAIVRGTAELQLALDRASRKVEALTQRLFEPRYRVFEYSVRGETPILFLDEPVIAIEKIEVDSGGVIPGSVITTDVDLSNLRVFNRHLTALLSPDDRDNPKLAFAKVGIPSIFTEGRAVFPEGEKNVRITGVFGYTDPDNGPFGRTPTSLSEIVIALAAREVLDPLGSDIATQMPGRITEAETRDQRVKFAVTGGSSAQSEMMTGDPRLDSLLMKYVRPAHIGVAGV